jgi:hypothetical protein
VTSVGCRVPSCHLTSQPSGASITGAHSRGPSARGSTSSRVGEPTGVGGVVVGTASRSPAWTSARCAAFPPTPNRRSAVPRIACALRRSQLPASGVTGRRRQALMSVRGTGLHRCERRRRCAPRHGLRASALGDSLMAPAILAASPPTRPLRRVAIAWPTPSEPHRPTVPSVREVADYRCEVRSSEVRRSDGPTYGRSGLPGDRRRGSVAPRIVTQTSKRVAFPREMRTQCGPTGCTT